MVPPDWSVAWCQDLRDALNVVLRDNGFAAVVTPGTAVAVGQRVVAVQCGTLNE
jgi:hypothetical protein